MRSRGLLPLQALASAIIAACGGSAAPPPVAARAFEDPGFVGAGGYEMHYGLLPAGDLAAGVAAAYGIDRDAQQVVVAVSVLKRQPAALPIPVEGRVTGSWRGLISGSQPLEFRAVLEGGSVSYIAEVPLRSREAMIFELAAVPDGANAPLTARITREFATSRREP